MKKVVTLLTLVAGAGLAFGQAVVHSPGIVAMQNSEAQKSGVASHLVTNFDGTLLIGTQYQAELMLVTGGTKGLFDGSLTPVPASISTFKQATTSTPGVWNAPVNPNVDLSFLNVGGVDINNDGTGAAGVDYADPVTGLNPYPGADGTGHYPIMLRVVAWDASGGVSYANASVHGQSKNFIYMQQASSPPAIADTQMLSQPGFALIVPEPSAIALSVLGVAGLLLIRRRK